MGFFKKLVFGAVAVVAAPVVLPAAAGMAAAGAAAAATAAAGAVGAAGAAVAGTAVGSAAVGAMATVGTAVGGAAGAVGLTSVAAAAGTATGAAAVGTIATSAAIGAQQTYSAKTTLDEAKAIERQAKEKYNTKKSEFEKTQGNTKSAIEKLAEDKKVIAERLQEFNAVFRKIKNPTEFGRITITDSQFRGIDADLDWEAFPIALKDITTGILKSYAGGNIIGLAITGGLASGATAGTGVAISTLSGAAATNATLAALGGGTIASGGLGMAGGAVVAKGLAFAPAFAIGGIMLNYKSGKVLDEAKSLRWEVERAVANMDQAIPYLNKLTKLSSAMSSNIRQALSVYAPVWKRITDIVYKQGHTDAAAMSRAEKMTFYAGIGLAKVLELQATKNFVCNVDEQNPYDVNNLITKSAVDACNYNAPGVVQFGNMPSVDLSQVIERAEVATRQEEEDKKRKIEEARRRVLNQEQERQRRRQEMERECLQREAVTTVRVAPDVQRTDMPSAKNSVSRYEVVSVAKRQGQAGQESASGVARLLLKTENYNFDDLAALGKKGLAVTIKGAGFLARSTEKLARSLMGEEELQPVVQRTQPAPVKPDSIVEQKQPSQAASEEKTDKAGYYKTKKKKRKNAVTKKIDKLSGDNKAIRSENEAIRKQNEELMARLAALEAKLNQKK